MVNSKYLVSFDQKYTIYECRSKYKMIPNATSGANVEIYFFIICLNVQRNLVKFNTFSWDTEQTFTNHAKTTNIRRFVLLK